MDEALKRQLRVLIIWCSVPFAFGMLYVAVTDGELPVVTRSSKTPYVSAIWSEHPITYLLATLPLYFEMLVVIVIAHVVGRAIFPQIPRR